MRREPQSHNFFSRNDAETQRFYFSRNDATLFIFAQSRNFFSRNDTETQKNQELKTNSCLLPPVSCFLSPISFNSTNLGYSSGSDYFCPPDYEKGQHETGLQYY
jgi:hypothetical protein